MDASITDLWHIRCIWKNFTQSRNNTNIIYANDYKTYWCNSQKATVGGLRMANKGIIKNGQKPIVNCNRPGRLLLLL